MTRKHHFFQPGHVDEQVDQLSLKLPGQRASSQSQKQESGQEDETRVHSSEQTEARQDMSARLVADLQEYYQTEFQQNREALARARWKIAAHQPAIRTSTHAKDVVPSH